jgi:alanyl-tRNA synthetase
MHELLYMDFPEVLEFETNILSVKAIDGGLFEVSLDQSYFYPTGGGQEHDTGTLNDARVIDVLKDEGRSPSLIHHVDRALVSGPAKARIDSERRFRHMQHHTAQHLLTQCFRKRLDLDTISANINGYTPTTLDLPVKGLDQGQILDVEHLAYQVIYENRPVRTFFASQAELVDLPIRKQPPVVDKIRIVEISGFDWTPCAGTHCFATGQVGIVKITRTERVRENLRVHFVAGMQAYDLFSTTLELADTMSAQLSVNLKDLPMMVQNQSNQLKQAQKELKELREKRIVSEANNLAAQNPDQSSVLLKFFVDRPANEIRSLADELRKIYEGLACLFTIEGNKLTAIVVCGKQSQQSARLMLDRLLALIAGKGGGDDRMAQGGAKITPESYQEFIRKSQELFQPKIK